MDKIFEANVSTTAPTVGTANGFPTDGDLDTGTPATIPGAGWFWMVTKELLELIEGAGIEPDGSDLTQVFGAVSALASAAASQAESAAIAQAETLAAEAQAAAITQAGTLASEAQAAAIAQAETLASEAQAAAIAQAGTLATEAQAAAITQAGTLASNAETAAIAEAETLATQAQTNAQNTVLSWFTGSNQSTAENGYQKLPGGRIEQECDVFVSGAGDTDVTVTYPITFPNFGKPPLPSIVDGSVAGGNESNFLGLTVISFSNSGCVIGMGQNGGGARDVTLHIEVTGR